MEDVINLPIFSVKRLTLLSFENKVEKYLCGYCTDFSYPEAKKFASSYEIKKSLSFSNDKRKQDFLLGRWVIKNAFKSLISDIQLTEVSTQDGCFGQPILTEARFGLDVSLSHNEQNSVAIVFPQNFCLGVDIENIRNRDIANFESHVTPSELASFLQQGFDSLTAFTLVWTIKEALSKAIKVGLQVDFSALKIKKSFFLNNKCMISEFEYFTGFTMFTNY